MSVTRATAWARNAARAKLELRFGTITHDVLTYLGLDELEDLWRADPDDDDAPELCRVGELLVDESGIERRTVDRLGQLCQDVVDFLDRVDYEDLWTIHNGLGVSQAKELLEAYFRNRVADVAEEPRQADRLSAEALERDLRTAEAREAKTNAKLEALLRTVQHAEHTLVCAESAVRRMDFVIRHRASLIITDVGVWVTVAKSDGDFLDGPHENTDRAIDAAIKVLGV